MTGLIEAPTVATPAAPPPRARTAPIIINLLPPEIVAAHKAREWRRRVTVTVVVVLLLIVGADLTVKRQAAAARVQTAAAQGELRDLQRQEAAFQNVEQTKAAAAKLGVALTGLMTGDVPWWQLLPAVRAAAPGGTTLTSVAGTLTSANTTVNSAGLPALGDPTAIGTLKIVGDAPSKDAIATFTDTLAAVRGLTNPYVTAVTAADASSYLFTMQVEILPVARGGRYSPAGGEMTRTWKSADRARVWQVGGLATVVAILLTSWVLLLHPQRMDVARSQTATDAARTAQLVELTRLGALRADFVKSAEYSDQLSTNREALPGSDAMPAFLRELQAAGVASGVILTELAVGIPTAVDASGAVGGTSGTAAATMYAIAVTLQANGDAATDAEFLHQLQQVQPRAVLFDTLTLAAAGNVGASPGFTLTASLRVFIDTAPAAPAPR